MEECDVENGNINEDTRAWEGTCMVLCKVMCQHISVANETAVLQTMSQQNLQCGRLPMWRKQRMFHCIALFL
jgi:hypothetical protein